MDFENWKTELTAELGRVFATDGADYIRQTGEDCWREMFEDGLSPADAAREEAWSAVSFL